MNLAVQPPGIALVCDTQGEISDVIRDELGFGPRLAPGQPVLGLAHASSAEKMRRFLMTVQVQRAAFDWEINTELAGRVQMLYFAGTRVSPMHLVVVATPLRHDMDYFYDELIKIANDQANHLRAAIKKQTVQAHVWAGYDSELYDELTRLNNELANAQRDLAKKNAELEKLNEERDRLVGMAAHDLRNPLTLIMAYSEFMAETTSGQLSAEMSEFLDTIRSSSETMLNMINDLLAISTLDSGRLQLERKPCDLVDLIGRNVARNAVLASRKQITMTFSHDDPIPRVPLDTGKIEQVLNNLLSNAVNYSFPETTVSVHLGTRDGEIVIAVADQGQGIPPAEIDRLFEPFARSSVRTTAGESSTGLGLAIVRRIVTAHEGRIWVESEPGKGSTFFVALPYAK